MKVPFDVKSISRYHISLPFSKKSVAKIEDFSIFFEFFLAPSRKIRFMGSF